MQALGEGVKGAGDDVCGEDVGGVGVWVAEEVGEGDGGERVSVGLVGGVEFDHCVFVSFGIERWDGCGDVMLCWR